MIPYEVDPSLHPAAPAPERLDDGFSPPQARQPAGDDAGEAAPPDPAQWRQSEF